MYRYVYIYVYEYVCIYITIRSCTIWYYVICNMYHHHLYRLNNLYYILYRSSL